MNVTDIVLMLMPTSIAEYANSFIPGFVLILAGLIGISIAREYVTTPEEGPTKLYYMAMLCGFIFAPVSAITIGIMYSQGDWHNFTIIVLAMITFAMFFRPFIKFNVSLTVSLLLGIITYYGVFLIAPNLVHDIIGFPGLVLIASLVFIFASIVLHFAELGFEFVAKIFNTWIILAILGGICLVEGILNLAGFSIFMFF